MDFRDVSACLCISCVSRCFFCRTAVVLFSSRPLVLILLHSIFSFASYIYHVLTIRVVCCRMSSALKSIGYAWDMTLSGELIASLDAYAEAGDTVALAFNTLHRML